MEIIRIKSSLQYRILLLLAALPVAFAVKGLPVETYASRSVLADGRWVKVSVSETGMHFIPVSTLRSWGFTDPSLVRVHGYGGNRQPVSLTVSSYRDDLPEVKAVRTSAGIYFYGEGPVEWTLARTRYTQKLNPYTTNGFYFLTQGTETPAGIASESGASLSGDPVTTFTDATFHEVDNVSLSHSGESFYGEDMRYTRSRSFKFDLPGLVSGTSAWMQGVVIVNSTGSVGVSYSADGTRLGTTTAGGTSADQNYGTKTTGNYSFTPSSNSVEIKVDVNPSGTLSDAYLDAITLNYTREIRLNKGVLNFRASKTSVALADADAATHVWDVTDPLNPLAMETTVSGTGVVWSNPYTGTRNYVAWNETASLPQPKMVSTVANQNLHGLTDLPDMVIFTIRDWAGEAERLANLHRGAPDNMNVLVVDQDLVFNEFSSGSRDPEGFRRMLKMLYDRGVAQDHAPRYVLFFGRPSYDNRCLTQEMKSYNVPYMPSWQSVESLSQGSSYMTDDYMVILEDNSGGSIPGGRLSMAVGRIPCRSLAQAKDYVDKIYEYVANKYKSSWKNSVVIEADNANKGCFMESCETMYNNLMASDASSAFSFTKVFVDAYPIQKGVSVKARERFYRALDEGVVFWLYHGHGAIETLGNEGLHTRSDIEGTYNERWPFLFASTCDFGRWDGVAQSGLEKLAFNRSAGIIGGVSATRKAYISDNNVFINMLGNHLLRRDADGRYKRIGDMIKDAKNGMIEDVSVANSMTKNAYGLLCDPALRLSMPSATVTLDSIGDEEVVPSAQVTVMARQRVRLSGSLYDYDGTPMTGFNGYVSLELFDAEQSTTSLGQDDGDTGGAAVTFEEKGSTLYVGRSTVVNGRWSVDLAMPSEVADNFRPAMLNMYAWNDAGEEAMGVSRDFYVYGYDDDADPDDMAPTIDYAYLNHSSFTNGSIVNEQPMFIAGVSDDVAINLSTAGIGHQMSLKLDDRRSFSDVSLYYTPSSDGSPSGTIAYPISDLEAGNHTLAFRVWDTSGNSATHTLSFFVEPGAAPQLFDIFTDVNPATDHANFYLSHNRPDAMATVCLDIYSMSGRRVWSSTVTGRSDMFLSTPIQWDLNDMGGRRVGRGIYIYRATLRIGDHEMQSQAKRIAVTGH